jgi:nicotinamide-nucleotide amidase
MPVNDHRLYELAESVGRELKVRSLTLATAESCTGGGVGAAVTMVSGSSEWFDCGFVTYTYRSKRALLGVTQATLDQHGAVSEQTVLAMVQGALERCEADVAVAVSGTAGPTGGTKEKPVGTVCLAWGRRGSSAHAETRHFKGDRESVRRQSVERALEGVLELLGKIEVA